MVRSALRLVLAVLVLAGYVPLPARGGATGPAEAASCCAVKACCRAARGAVHVCVATGAACEGPTGRRGAPRRAAAPWLIAGGCGTQTPLVTPVNRDPTLPAHSMSLGAVIAVRMPVRGTDDLTFLGHIPDPQVPPPRA